MNNFRTQYYERCGVAAAPTQGNVAECKSLQLVLEQAVAKEVVDLEQLRNLLLRNAVYSEGCFVNVWLLLSGVVPCSASVSEYVAKQGAARFRELHDATLALLESVQVSDTGEPQHDKSTLCYAMFCVEHACFCSSKFVDRKALSACADAAAFRACFERLSLLCASDERAYLLASFLTLKLRRVCAALQRGGELLSTGCWRLLSAQVQRAADAESVAKNTVDGKSGAERPVEPAFEDLRFPWHVFVASHARCGFVSLLGKNEAALDRVWDFLIALVDPVACARLCCLLVFAVVLKSKIKVLKLFNDQACNASELPSERHHSRSETKNPIQNALNSLLLAELSENACESAVHRAIETFMKNGSTYIPRSSEKNTSASESVTNT